jgi:hypothetical protein
MSLNKHAVSIRKGAILALNIPTCRLANTAVAALGPLTPADASNLAVWLLVVSMLAGHEDSERVLERFNQQFLDALNS